MCPPILVVTTKTMTIPSRHASVQLCHLSYSTPIKSQGRTNPTIMVNWDDRSHFRCLLAHFCQDWWCIPCWSIKMLEWQSTNDNTTDGANTRVKKHEGLLLATNVKSNNSRPRGPPSWQGLHEFEAHQWLLSTKTNTLAGHGKVWRHHDQCWGGCALGRLVTSSSLDSKYWSQCEIKDLYLKILTISTSIKLLKLAVEVRPRLCLKKWYLHGYCCFSFHILAWLSQWPFSPRVFTILTNVACEKLVGTSMNVFYMKQGTLAWLLLL
jgi:hypothetical protein